FGVVIPVIIYMYYVNIEAWCLGYALNFLAGNMHFETASEAGGFFSAFVGTQEDGSAIGLGFGQVGIYLAICFVLNFWLIYRGLSRGIELFCKYAMPTLLLIGVIIVIRVLTLGTPDETKPYNNVYNGMGFMWNPSKVVLQENVAPEGEPMRWNTVHELVGPRAVDEVAATVAANP